MRIGLGLGFGSQKGVSWTPANIFTAGQAGGWWDFTDRTRLFTDTGGTTVVTASGQAFRRCNDRSGNNNNATEATNGPTYTEDAGLRYAVGDGTNDRLAAGAANLYISASAYEWMAAARATTVDTDSNAYSSNRCLFGDSGGNIACAFRSSGFAQFAHYISSTSSDRVQVAYTAGNDAVFGSRFDGTTVTGAVDNNEATMTRGNIATTALTFRLFTRFDGAGGFFAGRCAAFFIVPRILTAQERSLARTYMASLQGRAL